MRVIGITSAHSALIEHQFLTRACQVVKMAAQERRKLLLSLLYEELFSDDLELMAFDAEKTLQ